MAEQTVIVQGLGVVADVVVLQLLAITGLLAAILYRLRGKP